MVGHPVSSQFANEYCSDAADADLVSYDGRIFGITGYRYLTSGYFIYRSFKPKNQFFDAEIIYFRLQLHLCP